MKIDKTCGTERDSVICNKRTEQGLSLRISKLVSRAAEQLFLNLYMLQSVTMPIESHETKLSSALHSH